MLSHNLGRLGQFRLYLHRFCLHISADLNRNVTKLLLSLARCPGNIFLLTFGTKKPQLIFYVIIQHI